jgi:hypothetical protein
MENEAGGIQSGIAVVVVFVVVDDDEEDNNVVDLRFKRLIQ